MDKPTSTQIGAIAENHVANALMLGSHGRLSVFQPLADDDGIDLLAYDKVSGRALPAQVKARTVTINKKQGRRRLRSDTVHFELRKATFRERHAVAIFVLLTEDATAIECAWIFPLNDVGRFARKGTMDESKKKFVFRMSRNAGSRDRGSVARCGWKDVAGRILDLMEQSGSISKLGLKATEVG